jgi:PAS domain S-box-containing protein
MEKINRKDQWASNIVIFMMFSASITLSLAVGFEVLFLKRFLYGSYFTIGLVVFLSIVGFYVVKTRKYKWPSYIAITLSFPLIVFRAVHSGQQSSPFMIYLPILPVMSYYVFNKKFGHYIVAMCLASLFVTAQYDFFFPFVASEKITFKGLAEVTHGIAAIGIITFFSLIFEKRTQLLNNELEVEQELLEGVNTNIPGIVYRAKYITSIGIEIVYMNKQVDNIAGVSREKYINKNILHWRENIIIDDINKVITKQREALDKKQNYEIAYRIKDKDGKTLHMNEKGSVVNDFRFLKMIGREKDLTTEDWEKLLHKNDINKFRGVVSEIIEGKTDLINQNFRIKHEDGHYLYMKAKGAVSEKDKDGNVLLLIGTFLDITEAEEAKMEREESRKQLFNMIQLLPVAVCMLDNNMNYLAHSLAWNKFITDNTELPLFDNFKENSPYFFEHFKHHIHSAKNGEIVKENEDYVVLENFESKYFEWESRPWQNATGDIEGIL